MTATVTLELPENILVQALRRLPPARRRRILADLEADNVTAQREFAISNSGKMKTLDKAIGLLATGENAPTDEEIAQLLEERRTEKFG